MTFNGIPRTLAAPPAKEPLILFVGRIIEAKGVADLVGALERVLPRHPGWRAEIIGTSRTPPQRRAERLRDRAAASAAPASAASVRWPGPPAQRRGHGALPAGRDRGRALASGTSRWPGPRSRAWRTAAPCSPTPNGGLPEVLRGRGLLIEPAGRRQRSPWRSSG